MVEKLIYKKYGSHFHPNIELFRSASVENEILDKLNILSKTDVD